MLGVGRVSYVTFGYCAVHEALDPAKKVVPHAPDISLELPLLFLLVVSFELGMLSFFHAGRSRGRCMGLAFVVHRSADLGRELLRDMAASSPLLLLVVAARFP